MLRWAFQRSMLPLSTIAQFCAISTRNADKLVEGLGVRLRIPRKFVMHTTSIPNANPLAVLYTLRELTIREPL